VCPPFPLRSPGSVHQKRTSTGTDPNTHARRGTRGRDGTGRRSKEKRLVHESRATSSCRHGLGWRRAPGRTTNKTRRRHECLCNGSTVAGGRLQLRARTRRAAQHGEWVKKREICNATREHDQSKHDGGCSGRQGLRLPIAITSRAVVHAVRACVGLTARRGPEKEWHHRGDQHSTARSTARTKHRRRVRRDEFQKCPRGHQQRIGQPATHTNEALYARAGEQGEKHGGCLFSAHKRHAPCCMHVHAYRKN
jgi:hypothetical protein